MGRHLIKISVITAFLLLYLGDNLYAGPGDAGNFYGNCTTYKVSVSKVETSTDNSNWVTLGEGAQEFDIASVSVGEQAGTYVSGMAIPLGTYRYMRITVSRTMKITGSGASGGTTYYTTAATQSVGGGQLGISSTNLNSRAECTIIIPGDAPSPVADEVLVVSGDNLIVTNTLDEPFTVSAATGTLHINFKTQITLEFDINDIPGQTVFWPLPPDVDITFQ